MASTQRHYQLLPVISLAAKIFTEATSSVANCHQRPPASPASATPSSVPACSRRTHIRTSDSSSNCNFRNCPGDVLASAMSLASPARSKEAPSTPKKGFFSKILRRGSQRSSRRSPTAATPESVERASRTSTSPSPITNLSISNREGSVVSSGSKRHSYLGFIDDDYSSLYDDDVGDVNIDSDTSSTASFGSPRVRNNSFDNAFDEYNEKIRFPTLNNSSTDQIDITAVPSNEDSPWAGLNPDTLEAPKYIKITKKNKHSPKAINNLFLAQELNTETDESTDKPTLDLSSSGEEDDADTPTSVNGNGNAQEPVREGQDPGKRNQGELFVLEFSRDGKYMAAAGRDSTIKIWKVISSPLGRLESKSTSPTGHTKSKKCRGKNNKIYDAAPVFHQKPYKILKGHTQSILTLDWSKNNFLLSGGMDRTVKLWHIEREECLQTFNHEDFVTCAKFHPNDDRFFLSGSLDNQVRLWSILESNIAYYKNLGDNILITALSVTPDGEFAIIGGFYGTVFALEVNGLHIRQRVDIKDRSIVHPFLHKNGNKITGIKIYETLLYNEKEETDPLVKWAYLISTNDSKIRLVRLTQKKLVTRFKGHANNSSSINASITDDNRYILSASEDHWCYVWENNNSIINNKLKQSVKDLLVEGKHHISDLQHKHKKYAKLIQDNKLMKKLLESDEQGEHISNENNSYSAFHAHSSKINAAIFAPESTKKLLELSDDVIFDLVKRYKACIEGLSSSEEHDRRCGEKKGSLKGLVEESNGNIIVTTDEYGAIRVFRQDSAHRIRKRLIGLNSRSQKNHSTEDLKGMNCDGHKPLKLELPAVKRLAKHGKSLSPSHDGYFHFKNKHRGNSKSSGFSSQDSKFGSVRSDNTLSSDRKTQLSHTLSTLILGDESVVPSRNLGGEIRLDMK
ncbi:WD40 repeat-like protein [Suhomyces tanzawaensis NRRL Y-17324]|uniref:WD40 repeat-like protein n=1 Tax=Suhomyces tanzawaensis NRRL Y-17324 TaxID=984487 RepID=A0A1E4SEB6_9ASCO|nr:WD40 repeat-like protein [Suhomyces tanzawaensis NRRL Y-17324]ODV77864.1 WD40 repeat-like protein [Suhomyces tanzawaensis NRRL Y-17324]